MTSQDFERAGCSFVLTEIGGHERPGALSLT